MRLLATQLNCSHSITKHECTKHLDWSRKIYCFQTGLIHVLTAQTNVFTVQTYVWQRTLLSEYLRYYYSWLYTIHKHNYWSEQIKIILIEDTTCPINNKLDRCHCSTKPSLIYSSGNQRTHFNQILGNWSKPYTGVSN